MSTNAIARRYAKALVQLGAEEGGVDAFNAELNAFNKVLSSNPALSSVFTNPAYGIEAKRGILSDLIAKLSLSRLMGNFLMLLLDRGRLTFLPQIEESYRTFADERSGVIRPTLTAALPLDVEQVEQIRAALAASSGKKVLLNVEVDPTLIGGVVTQIGDKVYDGSVKTQLAQIKDILQKG